MAVNKELLARMHSSLTKKFGADRALLMKQGVVVRSEIKDVIPTGIKLLDKEVLGIGGFPIGRMVEIYGPEHVGKTSLAYRMIQRMQRENDTWVAYADTEQAVSLERMQVFGVDPEQLLMLQPETIEEIFWEFGTCLNNPDLDNNMGLLIWDTLAGTMTNRQKEGLDDPKVKEKVSERALFLGQKLPPLITLLAKKRCGLIILNQVRQKIGGYTKGYEAPGGFAVRHHASIRLLMTPGQSFKENDKVVANMVYFRTVKNKCFMPQRSCAARFVLKYGWDERFTTIRHAKDKKIVTTLTTDDKNYKKALEGLGWYDPKAPLAPEFDIKGSEVEDDYIDQPDFATYEEEEEGQ